MTIQLTIYIVDYRIEYIFKYTLNAYTIGYIHSQMKTIVNIQMTIYKCL